MKALKILPLLLGAIMILSFGTIAVSATETPPATCTCIQGCIDETAGLASSCDVCKVDFTSCEKVKPTKADCTCVDTKNQCTTDVKNDANCPYCKLADAVLTDCKGKAPATAADCTCGKKCTAANADCPFCKTVGNIGSCKGFVAPEFVADEYGNFYIEGVKPLETVYSLDKGKKWLPIYSENLFLHSLATKKFDLWIKATSDLKNENVKKFEFKAPVKLTGDAIPKVNNVTEKITIPAGYEYTIGLNRPEVVVGDAPEVIDISAMMDKGGIIAVRKIATVKADGTDYTLPSAIYNIKVTAKPAAPKVVFDYKTDTVKVTDKMEYIYTKAGGTASTTWTKVPEKTKLFDRDKFTADGGILKVRIPGSDDGKKLKSAVATVVIPESLPAPVKSADAGVDGKVYFNLKTSELTGVTDKMEYSIDGGTKWTAVKKGATEVDLSKLFPAKKSADTQKGISVAVRYKYIKAPDKGSTDTHPSSVIEFDVNKYRPATPDKKVVKIDGTKSAIVGVDNTYEYRTIDGTTKSAWIAVATGKTEIDLSSVDKAIKFEVRLALDGKTLPSLPVSISVSAPPKTPTTPVLNSDSTLVTKVTTAMQYTITDPAGEGAEPVWVNVTGTTLKVSDIQAGDNSGVRAIYIRIKGTATKLPSSTMKLELPAPPKAKADKPSADTVKYVESSDTIVGVSNLLQYSVDNGTTWKEITGTSIARTDFTNATNKVLVRVKETTEKAASDALEVTVLPKVDAPSATTVEYVAGTDTIDGVTVANEYSVDNGVNWVTVEGTTITRANVGDAAVTVKVRVKAVAGVSVASDAIDVEVPSKPTV